MFLFFVSFQKERRQDKFSFHKAASIAYVGVSGMQHSLERLFVCIKGAQND